ncbi:flavin reductase family protein (plasmid) [Rhizobium grahamii]|uniref:Flavin reductase family protein n=1 Tax=Rhizobium grahamii TaxID=1120045 RepID=A0A5Q0CGL9_9HYPH|nr:MULTISPECIES: flavin reductase family protein [Rhizobium]QFY63201.1 flavin reductase family protein [Rhizobium grahamii]QRM52035.1 flavin reductase family protein [Rhizobium sp. BG6]
MNSHIKPVELAKAGRLVNHGPTVLVSARHQGVDNVMAVAWCCGLDFDPPKLTVVLDKIAHTRSLIEASGAFVVQVPTFEQVGLTDNVGTLSLYEEPNKLTHAKVPLFEMPGQTMPCVEGCSAWLACKVINEPHVQEEYDLFVAEVTAAWADDRVFHGGRWHFETAEPKWRSIHHVAGGHFYAIGEAVDAKTR